MPPSRSTSRCNRTICLPLSQEEYAASVEKPDDFRRIVDARINLFPELFPANIDKGYLMKDSYYSKKLCIHIRRITVGNTNYAIRPSFALPYMTGLVCDVEKALFLRKFSVPYWALAYVFGRDPMYWYRIETALGRNSLVGTTVRRPEDLPEHLAADEKHTWILGEKAYVATTVGKDCILGASIAKDAGEQELTGAYGVFKEEAGRLDPSYSPKTVNIDGWQATKNAWLAMFSAVIIICCFLHIYIKIRDRSRRKYQEIFEMVSSKLWNCYHAQNKRSFAQRVRRLGQWAVKKALPSVIVEPIQKLRTGIAQYSIAYDFPGAHRTSNMLDRLMQRMDRHLFSTLYFHGSFSSAELSIRGWALIHNFAPSNPFAVKKHGGFKSAAERLNRFRYHECWLQNLLVSASLGGFRSPPQIPL